jgi:hypothetical protein
MPTEDKRLRDQEVLGQSEYEALCSGSLKCETIEQDSNNFDFEQSRKETLNQLEEENLASFEKELDGEEIRNSVLVNTVFDKKGSNNREPTLADFKMIIVLGKGTFGKVFLAEFQWNKQLYAIKVIRKDILIEYNQIKNTKLEKDIMFKCQHQFLVGMEFLFMSELRLFFVMPFIRGGELYRFFKSRRRFKENEVKFYSA